MSFNHHLPATLSRRQAHSGMLDLELLDFETSEDWEVRRFVFEDRDGEHLFACVRHWRRPPSQVDVVLGFVPWALFGLVMFALGSAF